MSAALRKYCSAGAALRKNSSAGNGFGTAIKASYLRTWFEPISVDEDQGYLGVELQGGYDDLLASIGGYRRIQGDDDGWLATFGLGFRF